MATIEVFGQPTVAIPADAEVGEGPFWDHRTGRFCWVDITRGVLFENDLVTGDQTATKVDTMLGAAAPRATEDGFAVAVSEGFGFIKNGQLEIVDAVLPESYRRMNDAKCDSSGRLWAGSTHMQFEPGAGALHVWTGDGPSRLAASGFTLPNGIGWSPDDTMMYLVDSMARQLLSAPFNAADGTVGEFTQLAAIEEPGLPDGLTVDMDGNIWVAIWAGSEVRKYNPAGELVGRVPLPVDQPSSCAFAADGTLLITSATAGISEADLEHQPLAGSVFTLATTTHGVPVRPFEG